MINRVLIAALVFAAPVCPVSAQGTKVSVDMIGIGRMSCADWRSTQAHRSEGTTGSTVSGRDSIMLLQQVIKLRRKLTRRR